MWAVNYVQTHDIHDTSKYILHKSKLSATMYYEVHH